MVVNKSSSDCCPAYKLIVMDIHMPLMDGIEATKLICSKIKSKEVPRTNIVALSAGQLRTGDERFYYKEVGFAAYMSKPTTKDEFIKMLEKYGVI